MPYSSLDKKARRKNSFRIDFVNEEYSVKVKLGMQARTRILFYYNSKSLSFIKRNTSEVYYVIEDLKSFKIFSAIS